MERDASVMCVVRLSLPPLSATRLSVSVSVCVCLRVFPCMRLCYFLA